MAGAGGGGRAVVGDALVHEPEHSSRPRQDSRGGLPAYLCAVAAFAGKSTSDRLGSTGTRRAARDRPRGVGSGFDSAAPCASGRVRETAVAAVGGNRSRG